jgi:hypothetical protein
MGTWCRACPYAAIVSTLWLLSQPAAIVRAEGSASPRPASAVEQNAAIIRPLTEIGRVRARTPYCAALARARPGIDAAIGFEYGLPILAADIRSFRLDSAVAKHASLRKVERDLGALWDLAKSGRAEVVALRAAANADGVDEPKRREMLGFANALDGAKARQMMLAKSVSRVVGYVAELRVDSVVNTAEDDHASIDYKNRIPTPGPDGRIPSMPVPPVPTPPHYDTLADSGEVQRLFSAFSDEFFIREDLKTAAQHAEAAMQLGGCSSL